MTKALCSLSILLALLALAVGRAAPAAAQFKHWEGSSIIDDPEWRNRFLGSYGFLSGAEPELRRDELELLREVIELLKVNPEAAAAMLGTQVKEDSSAALDFILANLHFQTGKLDPAIEHYVRAIVKFPDFRRAHKNLGLLLVQRGDHGRGVEHLARAIELGDRDGRSYGLLGYCHIHLENHLAAEQAYRNAILQQPKVRDWKLGLARSLLAMEKYRDAVSLFASLIEDDPQDATAWLLQANAYVGLEQPRAAAVNLETVRMLGKAQTSTLVLLGDIYMNEGMYDLAAEAYLQVIQDDEAVQDFDNAYRAAELLIRTGAFDPASRVLAGIDERYGKQLDADRELKVLTLEAKVARAQDRDAEAAELLESIVRRDGTRGDALLELARYYRDQGQIEKALLQVERAEKLEDFRYRALLEHAQLQVGERDYAQAAALLEQALQIQSEPRVERFLARVEAAVQP